MKAPVESKAWGSTMHVFSEPTAAVSILETEQGGYCSRHLHVQRVNRFAVHSGVIQVVEYTEDGMEEVSRVTMRSGDVLDVAAGTVHRFEVLEPGIVVEVYFPVAPGCKVSHGDILRLDTGGKFDKPRAVL